MKALKTTMIAGMVFFVSSGIGYAADMDDLDVTIRMVESNDVHEMENELSLPESASDTAREHAESEDGHGLTQANESRDREHDAETSHDGDQEHSDQARDEHEDEMEHHDDVTDSQDAAHEEIDDAREEEQHEQEEEETQDPKPETESPEMMTDTTSDGGLQ
jgi:hypothetical protein